MQNKITTKQDTYTYVYIHMYMLCIISGIYLSKMELLYTSTSVSVHSSHVTALVGLAFATE